MVTYGNCIFGGEHAGHTEIEIQCCIHETHIML